MASASSSSRPTPGLPGDEPAAGRVAKFVRNEDLAEIFPELGSYDWLVFTSPYGVRFFFEEFRRVFDDIRSLGLMRLACTGADTAAAITALHLKLECRPEKSTVAALAAALTETGSLDSAKVLVVTGAPGRDALVEALEAARAIVDTLQVYKAETAATP